MANKIVVNGSNLITKAEKSATLNQKLDIGQILESSADGSLNIYFQFYRKSEAASGGFKLTLKDKNGNVVHKQVVAGQIGEYSQSQGGFQYVIQMVLRPNQPEGLIGAVMDEASIYTLQWGVSTTTFATGELSLEFGGNISEPGYAQMNCECNNPNTQVVADITMLGGGKGNISIKVPFTVVAI